MEDKVFCPHCGAEMLPIALPKNNQTGMWNGLTRCRNDKCKASGPMVCGCNREDAIEQAIAAARKRYVEPLAPFSLMEATETEYCFIEFKNAESGCVSKFSTMGRVSYADDLDKACIWRIGANMCTYASRLTYGAAWRCWERKPTPEESAAVKWRGIWDDR